MNVEFEADGDMSGSMEGGGKDYGKWWVRENRFCRQWDRWGQNKIRCPMIKLIGNTAEAYKTAGEKIDTWTLKKVPASLHESASTTSAPALISAEYLPLPVGTRAIYDNWSFKVDEVENGGMRIRTQGNDFRYLYGGVFVAGEGVFSQLVGSSGTAATLSLDDEDRRKLSALYPLAVGKSVEISAEEKGSAGQFGPAENMGEPVEDTWTFQIAVRETEEIDVANRRLTTFKIETKATSGAGRAFRQVHWYHPKSGLVVKLERHWSGVQVPHGKSFTRPGDLQAYQLQDVVFPSGSKNALSR